MRRQVKSIQKTLKKIIQQNNLKDFDNVKILPTSKEQKNNI